MEKNWISLENRYNASMNEIQKFALAYKPLFWDIQESHIGGLTDVTILERVFCYGNWDQYKYVEKSLGKDRAREIFLDRGYMPRMNLREETINLFTHYFHVTPPSEHTLSRAI